jgi:DNA-binding LytR/AlgR family response regulator
MNPKVLIVEDELVTATEFKEAMLAVGFEVPIIADKISDAILAFESMDFDLILLDITLKYDSLTGLFFAEYVRKSSQVPIIFITGDTNDSIFARMNSLGNCMYLMKAVRTPELVFNSKMMLGKNVNTKIDEAKHQEFVLLPINKSHQKVKKSTIVAISGNGSSSNIYISTEHHYHTLSMNMKKLLEGLNYPDFFRLNRSHVININFIDRIEKDQLILNAHNLKFALAKGQKTEILEFLPSIKT